MTIIKCKMCGGDLVIEPGSTVAECEYCGNRQTVPTVDNEKKLTLFARANRLRSGCEFDKAAGVYESIVADFPEEAEAYWGLVLCKIGIEYVDDPAIVAQRDTISAGTHHTVGLKADGTLAAAGSNRDLFDICYTGQCDVSDWKDIVAISAGALHTVTWKVICPRICSRKRVTILP